VSARRGIYVAPFDELAEPATMAELARSAEERGWDGLFLWDHVNYRAPVKAVADVWIMLAAIASATERLRIGPMVTPLSRRRIQKVARETVTLDHLCRGRLTFGVGLGSARNGELEPFDEVVDPRERARLLDQGMDRLAAFWAGEFEPIPIQRPRIPVWVAGRWPNRRPVRRAARWDGFFPIDLTGPDDLSVLAAELRDLRADPDSPFDLVVEVEPGEETEPWEAAGATWVLTGSSTTPPKLAEVQAAIEAGPS
jgi:alkanesulfonate monooxygenase SsuD/methylene tetrahydromethanopterin reductase-like flavin-dependent oxidoreductase (luciferase family)